MRYLLFTMMLFSVGCDRLLMRPHEQGPSQDYIYQDAGIIKGTTISDHDQFHNVSFTDQTGFQIEVNGVMLNKYEYTVKNNVLTFGADVFVWPNGSYTYQQPPIPCAPKGSMYTIQWDNP